MSSLEAKRVLLVGGTSGVAREIARPTAAKGAEVIVAGRHPESITAPEHGNAGHTDGPRRRGGRSEGPLPRRDAGDESRGPGRVAREHRAGGLPHPDLLAPHAHDGHGKAMPSARELR